MKVYLINPPIYLTTKENRMNVIKDILFFNSPPLGLSYIAAVLLQNGIDVKILDAPLEHIGIHETIEKIKAYSPDIIGLSILTNSFNMSVSLAKQIKADYRDVPVVVGGPHINADPEGTMNVPEFDYAISGEGEYPMLKLANALSSKSSLSGIKGLMYRQDGKVINGEKCEFISDLDELPFPARQLLKLRKYKPIPNDERKLPKIQMVSSRGCPYGCIFCDKNVFGRKYRSNSPEYVVTEIEEVVKKYKAGDIAFVESNFTANPVRVERICDLLLKKDFKIGWTCSLHASTMTKELLKKMKSAGCWRVRVGIESGSQKVLDFIQKGITLEQVKNVVTWADELGLQPKGFLMVGHLIDTQQTIEDSINFVKTIPLHDLTFQINTPMYNTPQYHMYKDYGRFEVEGKIDFTYWQPTFIPNGMTKEKLLYYHRKGYREFYLRPALIKRHLKQIKSIKDLNRYFRGFKLLLKLFFSSR